MRKISAHYIYTLTHKPIKNGIIYLDDNGKVIKVSQGSENLKELPGLEFYSGVIVPGFLNAHCHLELSAYKNKIPQKIGLHGFLKEIIKLKSNMQLNEKAMETSDILMRNQGIVAVADICNTDKSFRVKQKSKISYLNFIEALGIDPARAQSVFNSCKELKQDILKNYGVKSIITPHSPYGTSMELWRKINHFYSHTSQLFSVHNQESAHENALFQNKSGAIYSTLSSLGINYGNFQPTGKSACASYFSKQQQKHKLMLIHNTYTSANDIEYLQNEGLDISFCMCPKSNLFIENKLPDIPMFINKGLKLCIGTDSLASNSGLSIIEELKTIRSAFPQIGFEEMLHWACLNPASLMGFQAQLGSIEPGKKPGINLIENFDYQNMHISPLSKVKVLC